MFLLLFLFIPLLYYIYLKTNHVRILAAKLPGEFALPFVGNAHQLGFSLAGFLPSLMYMLKKYNYDLFRIFIGPPLYIVITNPDDVKVLLSDTTNLGKAVSYEHFRDWLGDGLLLSSGQKWKNNRKIITPTFHFKILEQFVDIMENQTNVLVEKLSDVANEEVVDVWNYISACSLDIIAETAMGVTLNAQENAESEIVKSIDITCASCITRATSAWKQFKFLYKLTPDSRRYDEALRVIKSFNDSVITQRKTKLEDHIKSNKSNTKNEDDPEFGQKKKLAFLDMLLMSNVDGKQLTNEEISDEVSTFIFAGHDTITSSVSYGLYNLANNPGVQVKVFAEQQEIFGDIIHKNATFQDYQNMKYMDLFIKELLRIHPPSPLVGRYVNEDMDMNGRILPAGANVLLFIYGMNHNPKIFPNPDKFDPDRFLPENRRDKHPFEYVPFSAGQRNCVGFRFANLEMKVMLSKLIRSYEFITAGPEHTVTPVITGNLKSLAGVKICMKRRL